MIVASVNPQPQQTRPGNEMFGEIVPHPQGSSALLNETSMVKVHPLPPQPSGPVDISVVPYDGFVQHAYSQSSAQPPPHHPSNQIHDAVVISSSQHPGQPHGAVMPSYMQQQQMAHPSQVQSQDNLLLGHYQQSAHPHDLVLSSPHQQYSPHPPGAIVFASPQNAYPQPHEILSAQQQFVGQPSPPHFPGVLMSPTHQHPSFGPHDGVVHAGQAITNQPPYPMHDPLLSPSPHHAGLLHTPVMVNPHMSNSALPGQPPVPAGNPHQYPGQLHGSVIPAFHSQYPGSLQGTVVPGPPPPNGMIPPTPQHAAPLHGAVVPPNQHPNPLTGGIISPMHQHQNPGLLHNSLLPSPGSLQGTIVSHQHTSPIHSAAVMPTHHHQQQQQQHHPAAIFGNLTSHHQHPGSLHPSVLPCPRQHPSSGRLHNNPGSSSSRQQHGVLPTPSLHHYSSSKSNDNDSAASHHLASSSSSSSSSSSTTSSSSSSSSSSLSSSSKVQESTGGSTTPTTMTTTNSTAGSRHSPKVINSTITTPSQPMSTQSKFFSTSTVSSSVASDSNGQNLSQHVPIKKLGTLASKSNNYNDTRINHKTGQSYKDLSSSSHSNDSTTQQGSNKISTSTYNNNNSNSNNNNNQHHHHHHHGPWELRNSYSIHSSSYKNASVPSTSSETNVNTTDRSVSTSHRTLPSRSSIIPPRMSLSVNGMLPPGNNMVGKFFGYQHSNGSTTNSRAISPLSSKKDSASSSSSSDVDAITTGLEKSRLHDNNQFYRQLDNTNGNTRRRYVSESWRRQNGEAAAASYTYTKQRQPLWSSSPKDQIKVVNLPVDQMKRPVYPLKVSKNSYSSVEGTKNQPRDTLHLTFFLH